MLSTRSIYLTCRSNVLIFTVVTIGLFARQGSFARAELIVNSLTTDDQGIKTYRVVSVFQGADPTTLRVLAPDTPAPGKPHRFLYVLPVERDGSFRFGDGLVTARNLNVHNRFNMTLIAPGFHIQPWYGDHDTQQDLRLESFLVRDVLPFIDDNFAAPGTSPKRLLVGFSKSGTGALSLALRNSELFHGAAAWDAPFLFDRFRFNMAENFGSLENFTNNYQIPNLLNAHADQFKDTNRLWIGGGEGNSWQAHLPATDQLMTSLGIAHTFDNSLGMTHRWDRRWVENAVIFLDQATVPEPSTFILALLALLGLLTYGRRRRRA